MWRLSTAPRSAGSQELWRWRSARLTTPCQATAGWPERGRFPGPLAAQQDVRGQTTWPACVIWGKSLAFSESLLTQLHSGDGHRARPTCCRRCGQKPRCGAAACCIDVYTDSSSEGAKSCWWVLFAKPSPCPTRPCSCTCPVSASLGSAPRHRFCWQSPSPKGSACGGEGRGGTWTCSTGDSPRMLQRPARQGRRVSPRPRQGGRVPCTRASKVMPTAPLLCCGSKVRRHLSAGASVSSFPNPQIMEAPHNVSGEALRKTLL